MRLLWLSVAAALPDAAASPDAESAPLDARSLEATTAALFGAALASNEAHADLRELCDDIGHRLSGSPELDRAIAWAAAKMDADGLKTRLEPVLVPHWVRGEERLEVVAPSPRSVPILALGNTVGTPKKGIEADVVVADDFDHLERLGGSVSGKIVLFDVPFTNYGDTVVYRWEGPARAKAHGAVGMLLRSVTPASLYTPHTGSTDKEDGVPAAAVTVEDAAWMRRVAESGQTVRVRLTLGAHFEEEAPSHNVIGEIPGRESPEQVVVVGCHLDSWDVGQGAQDDGAGCVMAMNAGALIAKLPERPRRTVRVVLFTNEENGLRGGGAYAEAHASELPRTALIEADTGAGRPLGFRVHVDQPEGDEAARVARVDGVVASLDPLRHLLSRIDAGNLQAGHSGADIGPSVEAGALGFGLQQDMSGYWPIHHTEADTFEKVDPKLLAWNTAAVTALTWWLAEAETLP